jgi:hypothetical protein
MDSRATFNYMSKLLSNAAGITVLILLSCTSAPRAVHVSRGAGLIGKATQELLSCAGTPLRETHTGSGTVLKYYKEAPMLEESFVGSKGSTARSHHGCWASVSIVGERVIGVTYESVPTPAAADDHCEEIFEACAQ